MLEKYLVLDRNAIIPEMKVGLQRQWKRPEGKLVPKMISGYLGRGRGGRYF